MYYWWEAGLLTEIEIFGTWDQDREFESHDHNDQPIKIRTAKTVCNDHFSWTAKITECPGSLDQLAGASIILGVTSWINWSADSPYPPWAISPAAVCVPAVTLDDTAPMTHTCWVDPGPAGYQSTAGEARCCLAGRVPAGNAGWSEVYAEYPVDGWMEEYTVNYINLIIYKL